MSKYTESDVSILIPVFKPGPYFKNCIKSALATSSEEIIVSINDFKNYPIYDFDHILDNKRISVIRQQKQLGLWGNHLFLLRESTKPWIKFLHGDDLIKNGFLKELIEYADDKISVIGVVVLYQDLKSGLIQKTFELKDPVRWTSDDYMKRVCITGNELGCPSSTLYRRDSLDFTEEAWANNMNSDYVANIIAASRGDVMLIPPGGIISGNHSGRDSFNQGFESFLIRHINDAKYLNKYPNIKVNKVGIIYGYVEGIGVVRSLIGMLRRGKKVRISNIFKSFKMVLSYLPKVIINKEYLILSYKAFCWKFSSTKYGNRENRDVTILKM